MSTLHFPSSLFLLLGFLLLLGRLALRRRRLALLGRVGLRSRAVGRSLLLRFLRFLFDLSFVCRRSGTRGRLARLCRRGGGCWLQDWIVALFTLLRFWQETFLLLRGTLRHDGLLVGLCLFNFWFSVKVDASGINTFNNTF